MHLIWLGQYFKADGYGRFNSRFIKGLLDIGVKVKAATFAHLDMPEWLQKRCGLDWNHLTITCSPPFSLLPVPGRHWIYTMTEGSRITQEWVDKIETSGVERVIVPCEHNVRAFRESGVTLPISVIPGGVDPQEFPEAPLRGDWDRPYTFLTFSDRGSRKGWEEVWEAFYLAFGGRTGGEKNVRLIVKGRDNPDSLATLLSKTENLDGRVTFLLEDIEDMQEVYSQVDCLVLPSRSEGWGMIHREVACMGIPVITQKYSGMDDGYIEKWALVVRGGELKPIPREVAFCLGEWMVADTEQLSLAMRCVQTVPEAAASFGESASSWLKQNQTWRHSALRLVELIEKVKHGEFPVGRAALRTSVGVDKFLHQGNHLNNNL